MGAVKALEARGIEPDVVGGAHVGALYAYGMNGIAMNKLALKMEEARGAPATRASATGRCR
jgi:NTE family protein